MKFIIIRSLIAAVVVAVPFMWLSVKAAEAAPPPRYAHKARIITQERPAILRSARRTEKLVIIIHGGGWRAGNMRDSWKAGIDQYAMSRGYDVLAIDYPLQLGDAPRSAEIARNWVRWGKARYNSVTLLGGSAGGYLAIAASDAGADRVIAVSPAISPGADITQGSLVWPVAWQWGFNCTDCEEHRIKTTSAPTTILHARNDRATAYEGSYFFQRDNARTTQLITFDGAQHGWTLVWRSSAQRLGL